MRIVIGYLAVPMLLALVLGVYGFVAKGADFKSLLVMVFGGFFFYGVPYLVWVLVHLGFKPTTLIVHSGYIGATFALALISSVWLLPSDPSGLPLQWMAYWPLALALMLICTGIGAAIARLLHSQ